MSAMACTSAPMAFDSPQRMGTSCRNDLRHRMPRAPTRTRKGCARGNGAAFVTTILVHTCRASTRATAIRHRRSRSASADVRFHAAVVIRRDMMRAK